MKIVTMFLLGACLFFNCNPSEKEKSLDNFLKNNNEKYLNEEYFGANLESCEAGIARAFFDYHFGSLGHFHSINECLFRTYDSILLNEYKIRSHTYSCLAKKGWFCYNDFMEAIIFSKYGNDIFEKTYKRAIVIEYNNKHSKFLEQIDTVDFRDTVALLCDLQHFLDFSQIEISYVINDYEDITEKRKKALKTEREKINILKNYCDDCCNKYSIVYDTLGIPREIIIKQKVSDKCKKELLRVTPNFGVFQYNKKKKPYIWEHK